MLVCHLLTAALLTVVFADVPSVKINPNVNMPMLAFGTAKTSLGDCSVTDGVKQWLKLGGRHIDTADDYGTQPDVGRALKASSIPRKEIFITTKIPGPIGANAVTDKIMHTALPQLGVDYIDLVLIHFPCVHSPCEDGEVAARLDTYKSLMSLRDKGIIRSVGVSNYDTNQVEEIRNAFNEAPAVNQVQFHLAYHNETLLANMKKVGTVLEAWASLGGPTVHGREPTISLSDSRLKEVAVRYNVSTAQIVFAWENEKGVVPVTATCSAAHAISDLNAFSFKLSQADMVVLDALMPAEPLVV